MTAFQPINDATRLLVTRQPITSDCWPTIATRATAQSSWKVYSYRKAVRGQLMSLGDRSSVAIIRWSRWLCSAERCTDKSTSRRFSAGMSPVWHASCHTHTYNEHMSSQTFVTNAVGFSASKMPSVSQPGGHQGATTKAWVGFPKLAFLYTQCSLGHSPCCVQDRTEYKAPCQKRPRACFALMVTLFAILGFYCEWVYLAFIFFCFYTAARLT